MKKLIFILPMLFAFVTAQGQGAMFLRGSQPAPTPGAGILDSYPGAAFAAAPDVLIYSSHSVTDNTVGSQTQGQTGPYTVLVRRDNDDALRSFTYTEVSDGTLTTWVGPANNGFVQILYDQSTNGNHATQSNAARQPKIVDNGSLVVENGKAALSYDGINSNLMLTLVSTDLSAFIIRKSTNAGGYYFSDNDGGANPRLIIEGGGGSVFYNGWTVTQTFSGGSQSLLSLFLISPNSFSTFQDGGLVGSATKAITSIEYFGDIGGDETAPMAGNIQLIISFPSDQSANRTAIETAINNEYSIYP